MESHKLSTQRIMCIFSLIKNFLRYAQILRRQPLHEIFTQLLQVRFCWIMCRSEKQNLFQTPKLNCFLCITGKVKRSYGVIPFGVHLKRNISKWSTTVCTFIYPHQKMRSSMCIWYYSETGGLLRIGIKLMMACCTTNTDVYVPLKICVKNRLTSTTGTTFRS